MTIPKPDCRIADDSPFTRLENAMKALRQARFERGQGLGDADALYEKSMAAQKEYQSALRAINSINKGYEAFQSPAKQGESR